MLVWFLAKIVPKFLISFTNPLTSIPVEIFWKTKQLTTTFGALGSNNGCGYTIYVETSRIALFAWTLLKLGVSMVVAFLAGKVEISFLQPCLASIQGRPQIRTQLVLLLFQWKEEGTLGTSPFPNAVLHTSHRPCAIPGVLSVSSAGVETTSNSSFNKSCPCSTRLHQVCQNQRLVM